METLRSLIGDEAADELLAACLPSIQDAYRYWGDLWSPSHGMTPLVYGLGTWTTANFNIEDRLASSAIFSTSHPRGSFVVSGVEGISLRVWKLGFSGSDSHDLIRWRGSHAKQAPGYANALQASLSDIDGGESFADHTRFLNLALGHMGNPHSGCCKVIVGAPRQDLGWHWSDELWAADLADTPTDFSGAGAVIGSFSDLPSEEPSVRLRQESEESRDLG